MRIKPIDPRIDPSARPASNSRRMTRNQSRRRNSPSAMARMTSVVACDPELPPLEMISGTKSASTTAFSISLSNTPMAVAVSISPRKSAASQPARLRIISLSAMVRYGSPSDSEPPSFWMSSVASWLTTSTMSSTVTMPFIRFSLSTTGTAIRPVLRTRRATAS